MTRTRALQARKRSKEAEERRRVRITQMKEKLATSEMKRREVRRRVKCARVIQAFYRTLSKSYAVLEAAAEVSEKVAVESTPSFEEMCEALTNAETQAATAKLLKLLSVEKGVSVQTYLSAFMISLHWEEMLGVQASAPSSAETDLLVSLSKRVVLMSTGRRALSAGRASSCVSEFTVILLFFRDLLNQWRNKDKIALLESLAEECKETWNVYLTCKHLANIVTEVENEVRSRRLLLLSRMFFQTLR